jgi:hypothetical protein
MKLQTSCSLHLIFSQPADVPTVVSSLVGFLWDQGVDDQKFLAEFRGAAAGAVNCAIECWSGEPDEKFANITLTINSVEVRLEIVAPSDPEEQDGKTLLTDQASREFLQEQVTTGMALDVDRDGMHVIILRKSLGQLSWNYKPEFQERLLASCS